MPIQVDNIQCVGEYASNMLTEETLFNGQTIRSLREEFVGRHGLAINLLLGFDDYKPLGQFGSRMSGMLALIAHKQKKNDVEFIPALTKARIISRRNLLARIAETAYYNKELDSGFEFVCVRHKNVLYLSERVYDDEFSSENEYQAKNCYKGTKFEQILTCEAQRASDEPSIVADKSIMYNAVCRCSLRNMDTDKSHELLLASKVDCIDDYDQFVELMLQRASRDVKDLGLQMSMRKQMRTYVRSLLSGQRRIIIGFYSKNRLVEVREIDREEELLNEIITWNPDRCIEYLYGFITELRNKMNDFPEGTYVKFEREAQIKDYKVTPLPACDPHFFKQPVDQQIDVS